MRLRVFKKYAIGAGGMLVLVMAILLATGWGSAVAAQVSNVFVTNDAAHAVPVQQQGTANVNVTNGVSVTPGPAITGGGGVGNPGPPGNSLGTTVTATALVIHLTSEILEVRLEYQGQVVAFFFGPAHNGSSDIQLALTRPIKFDTIGCGGSITGTCSVGWIGAAS